MRDELTGASHARELATLVRYHGLTREQALEVLSHDTHRARDEAFARIVSDSLGRARKV